MEELPKHQSILVGEVIELLQPRAGQTFLDGTFGGGGHSRALLESGAAVVAVDRDPEVERFTLPLTKKYGEQFRFEVMAYDQIANLGESFDGALLDLGMSTDQLESSGRGFSHQHSDEPLDLRFDGRHGQTAAQFLNQASLPKIETVFRELAEDRYWRRLSGKIVSTRRVKPIRTVGDFVTLVGSQDPKVLSPLFQALRITVNDELTKVQNGLEAIGEVLTRGGRLAVISFHSLEDRLAKEFFRSGNWEIVTKKPVIPSIEEIAANPRSRSAKLRVGIKR